MQVLSLNELIKMGLTTDRQNRVLKPSGQLLLKNGQPVFLQIKDSRELKDCLTDCKFCNE